MELDNHPIPQDVTGFKFKLIGNITIKQFLYLLLCAFFAYIFYVLPLIFIVKLPFIVFFAALGGGLAFVPVEGRPMDRMLYLFIKALPADNQYIYKKKGAVTFLHEIEDIKPRPKKGTSRKEDEEQRLRRLMYLNQLRSQATQGYDNQEIEFINSVKQFFIDSAFVAKPIISPLPPTQEQKKEEKETFEPAEKVETQRIITASVVKKEEKPTLPSVEDLDKKLKELQAHLEKTLAEKEALQKKFFEIAWAKKKEEAAKIQAVASDEAPHARSLSGATSVAAGFPILPDVPNILLGIVKDPRGKVLQNILVEVMDKNDIPVRAFKTNALGQFISATPLPNGTYHIRFEDPQKTNEFDVIEVQLTGSIFQPLEITSSDQREKLRKELFG